MFWKILGALALAAWFGGGIVAGFVAPQAAFKFLASDTQLAGSIAGEVLTRFHLICMVSGAVYGLSWAFARRAGGRPPRWALIMVVAALLLVVYTHFSLGPRIAVLRDTMHAAGETPELKGQFGALHLRSVIVFAVQWLLVWAALVRHTMSLARR